MQRHEPPEEIVDRLRQITADLPDAYEEQAWTGVRWRVRGRTFAHVVQIDEGGSPAFMTAARTTGPATVLTFQAEGPELDYLTTVGAPFFKPPWSPTVVGMVFGPGTDWSEVRELITDSYRSRAPRKLIMLLEQG